MYWNVLASQYRAKLDGSAVSYVKVETSDMMLVIIN